MVTYRQVYTASFHSTLLTFLFSRKLSPEPETGGPPRQGPLGHEATQEAGGADPSYWQGPLQPGFRGPQPHQLPTPVLREYSLPPAAEILTAAALGCLGPPSLTQGRALGNLGRVEKLQAPNTAPCQKAGICVCVCFLLNIYLET